MTSSYFPGLPWHYHLTAILFGLVLGSFFNVVICRLPSGVKAFFVPTGSHCPACNNRVRWYDNIPLLSYAILRGRCRDCGTGISLQYPIVEALTAIMVWWLYSSYFPYVIFYVYLAFFSLLLCMSVIDINQRRIPNSLLILGMVVGLFCSLITPFPGGKSALAGLALGYSVPLLLITLYETLRGKTLIGGGDIKLMGMIGAFIGWQPMGNVIFYSSLAGLLVVLACRCMQRDLLCLPFAPCVAMGTIYTLFEPDILKIFEAIQ